MPLYRYRCGSCGTKRSRILVRDRAQDHVETCGCGQAMARDVAAPTAQVTERLDNGFMTRALERPADAERLYRDRAKKDPLADD